LLFTIIGFTVNGRVKSIYEEKWRKTRTISDSTYQILAVAYSSVTPPTNSLKKSIMCVLKPSNTSWRDVNTLKLKLRQHVSTVFSHLQALHKKYVRVVNKWAPRDPGSVTWQTLKYNIEMSQVKRTQSDLWQNFKKFCCKLLRVTEVKYTEMNLCITIKSFLMQMRCTSQFFSYIWPTVSKFQIIILICSWLLLWDVSVATLCDEVKLAVMNTTYRISDTKLGKQVLNKEGK
jgi:hypothetical protein